MVHQLESQKHYIFQPFPINPYQIKAKTVNAIFNCNLAHVYAGSGIRQGMTIDWWLPPPPGWIKLNFYGALNCQTGKASIDGVVRDPYGKLLLAYTCEIRALHPLETELMALQKGLLLLESLLPAAIPIEGDCLVLVTSIKTPLI